MSMTNRLRPRCVTPGWVASLARWRASLCWGLGALITLALLAGCGPFVEGHDYRIDQARRIIYTRSAAVAEAVCAQRGTDYATHRARAAGATWAGGAPGTTAQAVFGASSPGCWDPRDDVIVVEEHNPVAEAHELAHRRGWQHP